MYHLTWLMARFVGLFPVAFMEALARGLSFLAFDILRIRRKLIIANIQTAFPNLSVDECCTLGRTSFYHFAVTLLETIRGGNHDLLKNVTFVNRGVMDEAMSQGKGIYLLCIHMGNFETLGGAISTTWRPATVPVKYLGHGGFDRYVHEQRMRYNIEPVRRAAKGEAYAAVRRALAEGRPVGFMLDQSRHGQPRLPLFGKPAKTNTSIAAIWQKCKAPLVPLYIRRLSFGVHEVVFLPEIVPVETGDSAADILDHSAAFNRVVEEIVRRHPEQYWWLHNRWK